MSRAEGGDGTEQDDNAAQRPWEVSLVRRLYQREQAEQDKSDAQRFHVLLQVLGRTCLDAATDDWRRPSPYSLSLALRYGGQKTGHAPISCGRSALCLHDVSAYAESAGSALEFRKRAWTSTVAR